MAITVDYPGVYIDEFEPAAPIQGVGTAVPAFLGLSTYGPPMEAKQLTSWDAYLRTFAPPLPTEPEDDDFLYYAVRGFFANGGRTCFVTAISNATPDFVDLDDQTARRTIRLTARRSGPQSPAIEATVAASNSVMNVALFKPEADVASATAGSKSFDVGDAAKAQQFLVGDEVIIGNTTKNELAVIARRPLDSVVYLQSPLNDTYTNVKLRLAPLPAFATTFRVVDATPPNPKGAAKLVVGSIITVTQGTGASAPAPKTTVVTAVRSEFISSILTTYRVTVRDGLNGFRLYGTTPITLQSEEFDLTVGQPIPSPAPAPNYPGLSMEPLHPRYYMNVINSDAAGLISARPIEPPAGKPTPATKTLAGAQSHDAAAIKSRSTDYERALALLEPIGDINMVVAADRTDLAVQKAVLDHCSRLHDRFAIFDSRKTADLQDIEVQRDGLENDKGFGALYYPWIEVTSAKTGKRILVPPSGHVAGIYARTDLNRGVFKAPAGNESAVNGALGVEKMLSNSEQGIVNRRGRDVIRVFQRGGVPIVWGARTTTRNTNWQYVNIRRLFLFLEESIQVGIRGSVFEPNNPELWQRLKRTISAFLTQQWRDGALFGATAKEAFYVRIDEAINPPDQRALGRLTIEIGVKPSYPAEFIVVRIGIWEGGSQVTE